MPESSGSSIPWLQFQVTDAMFSLDVSLTLHCASGGEVMILGAPGCHTKFEVDSFCFGRAKLLT